MSLVLQTRSCYIGLISSNEGSYHPMSNAVNKISVALLVSAGICYLQKRKRSGKRRLLKFWLSTKSVTLTTNSLRRRGALVVQKLRVAWTSKLTQPKERIVSGKFGKNTHVSLARPQAQHDAGVLECRIAAATWIRNQLIRVLFLRLPKSPFRLPCLRPRRCHLLDTTIKQKHLCHHSSPSIPSPISFPRGDLPLPSDSPMRFRRRDVRGQDTI